MLVAGWEDEEGREDEDEKEEERSHLAENEGEGGKDDNTRRRRGKPCLYWLDSLGAVLPLAYAAHGEAAAFLMGFLDQQYHQLEEEGGREGGKEGGREGGRRRKRRLPSLEEAVVILERCYEELERRFLVNAGGGFHVKMIDREGVRTLILPSTTMRRRKRVEGRGGGGGGGRGPPPVVMGEGVKRGG